MASRRSKSAKPGEISYAQAIDAEVAGGTKRRAAELIRKQMMVEFKDRVAKALEAIKILQQLKSRVSTGKKKVSFRGAEFTKETYNKLAKNTRNYIKDLARIHDDNIRRAKNPTKDRKFARAASTRRVSSGLTAPVSIDAAVFNYAQTGAQRLGLSQANLPLFFSSRNIARQPATTLLRAALVAGLPEMRIQGAQRNKMTATGVSAVQSQEKAFPLTGANAQALRSVVENAAQRYAAQAQAKDAEAKREVDETKRNALSAEAQAIQAKATEMQNALRVNALPANRFSTAITPFLIQHPKGTQFSAEQTAAVTAERRAVTEANDRFKASQQ